MDSLSSLPSTDCEKRLEAKQIIEALLFASRESLSLLKIGALLAAVHPFKPRELVDLIHELKAEYNGQKRAFELIEGAEGFSLRTRRAYAPFLAQLFHGKQPERLSIPAMETLAIIAFRGPLTRPQIESLRGVDASGVLQGLLERDLIAAVGRLDAPGKPLLYEVTKTFLTHFGFPSHAALRQANSACE
jgi:segregation and condensation protein B